MPGAADSRTNWTGGSDGVFAGTRTVNSRARVGTSSEGCPASVEPAGLLLSGLPEDVGDVEGDSTDGEHAAATSSATDNATVDLGK